MKIQRADHLGLSALDNLGSHLFAIHEFSAAISEIVRLECGYEMPDERRVWLKKGDAPVAEIDLLANREPIIQRFIAGVEKGIQGGGFPLDLPFALRVAAAIENWKRKYPAI